MMKQFLRFGNIALILLFVAACSSARDGVDKLPESGFYGNGGNGVYGNYPAGSQQEFQQGVGDRVFFETDSSSLTAEAQSILDRQAVWLNQYSQHNITIEGHADERGTRQYNIALGGRRAAAVRAYLLSRGIESTRLQTTSFGKERPVSVCNDISCWSQNRRAVTIVR